ncbi:iron complex transport system permease protein [Nicoletella semolina]|uniref:Iron complex transport system permease protein n=1 Tax=Nicoletella semolina TaxID=271160 RepID=A0A4R2NBR1_9PAST|nr:iron ABC transporter permease [Nicoletella semolina]MDH2924971.1 iron ABC transporter permease [Nicoletella semolina]TCP18520.1 iron complex transport system permease protein [Nicoletella semolina]
MCSLSATQIIKNQRILERKRWFILFVFLIVGCIGLVLDVATGPSMLPISEVIKTLLQVENVDNTTKVIVYDLRLPMALMALVVGMALGVGGAEIQTLLNNPMASPYTLGIAAAAGLGASAVIAFGSFGMPSSIAVPIGAFVMTMIATGILFLFASLRRFSSAMLVLVGIASLFFFQSMLSLIQFISAPEISQQILFWLFGSLSKATWETLAIAVLVTAVCITFLAKDVWKLTALRLGETRALSLGINLQALRIKTLILVAVMTATAISFVGIIGFIGLVSPHIARLLVGEDQRFFLPASMLVGAAFLSLSSVLSKIIIPGALFPVGIVTAFIGVPFFFWIVLTKR